MARYGDIRTGRHRVFDSVFVTKYRHPVFAAAHLSRMEQIMRDVCRDFECELAEFNAEANHVHLLVRFPPKVALSRLVNSLKGMSSRRAAAGVPGPARALLAGEPAVIRLVLHRIRRRRPDHGPAPVHRAARSSRLTPGQGPSALTTGLKAGALADNLVATITRLGANGYLRTRKYGHLLPRGPKSNYEMGHAAGSARHAADGVRIGQDKFPPVSSPPPSAGAASRLQTFAVNTPKSPITWLVMRHHAS